LNHEAGSNAFVLADCICSIPIARSDPQVVEITHRHSSIWAQLGAEFRARPKHLAHSLNRLPLRVVDHVRVGFERNSCVRMSHLLLSDFRICTRIDQQAGAVPEGMNPGPGNFQAVEHGPQP
jgi:hypothetical protein